MLPAAVMVGHTGVLNNSVLIQFYTFTRLRKTVPSSGQPQWVLSSVELNPPVRIAVLKVPDSF